MTDYILIAALATSAAALILGILAAQRLLTDGAHFYRDRVVVRLTDDLKNAFIRMSVARLIALSGVGVCAAGLIGWLIIGTATGVVASLLAVSLPPWLVAVVKRRRLKRFVLQLPDCLNAMSSSLRGGSNLARAMELAAEQQPAPISQEFSVVLSEYRLGRGMEDALQAMADRVRCQEVALMNAAINISRAVGGNLADTFDSLAKTLREKAQVEGKIAALTAMGKMQGWVIALLPFFLGAVLYKQEPEGMTALVSEPIGWLTLAVLVVMLLVALFMVHRIVSIDV